MTEFTPFLEPDPEEAPSEQTLVEAIQDLTRLLDLHLSVTAPRFCVEESELQGKVGRSLMEKISQAGPGAVIPVTSEEWDLLKKIHAIR